MERFRHLLVAGLTLWLLSASWVGAEQPLEEASEAQRTQAELQARIDEADGETRELLNELRRIEAETRRIEDYCAALAPRLAELEASLGQREAALDGLDETRAALPALNRGLQARLQRWIDQDLPFLLEERRARVASLDDGALPTTERLERLLSAWRSELAYGRELDAWRGYLSEDETRREVDFLRLGRIGLYYLTPDGRQGAVWRVNSARWQALEDGERAEVRKGLRIARDQRAPELLKLPVSRLLEPLAAAEEKRL
ncbi:MAG: DUF3450 domain-containing protein [Marinobacter sp.]|uniref:DUF3450 domain-containing protein n=1 Tax=Marinobacter sp. TaxID=50741 RepID=UPI00396DC53F